MNSTVTYLESLKWKAAGIGLSVGALNHAAHGIRNLIQKANCLVVGIYGAGGNTEGNTDVENLIKSKGGKLLLK